MQFKAVAKYKAYRLYILKTAFVQIKITVGVFTLCSKCLHCAGWTPTIITSLLINKTDKLFTYNVTLSLVIATIVVVEKQYVLHILNACL